MSLRNLLVVCLLALLPGGALARDLLVAAPGVPDGRAEFASLGEALNAAVGGDRILLLPGSYGEIEIRGARFETPVVIAPAEATGAHVLAIRISTSSHLTIRGLQVWPLEPGTRPTLVHSQVNADHIRFEALDIRASPDAPDTYMTWTLKDWLGTWPAGGVNLEGPDNALIGSRIAGTGFAITASGARAEVRDNHVLGFSGDGIRGLGDNSVFAGNRVQDCFKVNDNHDDGFQSWARDEDETGRKVVRGIIIEANIILEWTGPADHPLHCQLQGIGLYDGIYRDFVIRNNLIVVEHWHGISVWGAQDTEIVNNTVVFPGGAVSPDRPWIMLRASKSGVDPGGNTLVNNVAMAYREVSEEVIRRNVIARYPVQLLRDPVHGDYRPRENGPLIDAADPAFAPPFDIENRPRPMGNGPDIGAYEVQ